jgi:hypothetical protein
MPVIGFLDSRSPDEVAGRLRVFRQGLKQTGYVEGENVAIVTVVHHGDRKRGRPFANLHFRGHFVCREP